MRDISVLDVCEVCDGIYKKHYETDRFCSKRCREEALKAQILIKRNKEKQGHEERRNKVCNRQGQ
jgi:hypothetical protein